MGFLGRGTSRSHPGRILFLLSFFVPLLLIHATGSQAPCAQVTLAWDENTETDVAGYRVHYGTATRDYSLSVNAGAFTSCIISGLEEGITYFFAATAYDSQDNESSYSEEVSFTIPVADSGEGSDSEDDSASGDTDPPSGTDTSGSDTTSEAEAESSDSSSTCFIGACASNQGFFERMLRDGK